LKIGLPIASLVFLEGRSIKKHARETQRSWELGALGWKFDRRAFYLYDYGPRKASVRKIKTPSFSFSEGGQQYDCNPYRLET
jgi:hypothetical protein